MLNTNILTEYAQAVGNPAIIYMSLLKTYVPDLDRSVVNDTDDKAMILLAFVAACNRDPRFTVTISQMQRKIRVCVFKEGAEVIGFTITPDGTTIEYRDVEVPLPNEGLYDIQKYALSLPLRLLTIYEANTEKRNLETYEYLSRVYLLAVCFPKLSAQIKIPGEQL